MRHVILLSGKDSLATALIQTTRHPEFFYEFIFNDVEAELPETYAWLDRVEAKTGWKITRVGKSLLDLIESYGGFLPGPRSRYCTRETKIQPLEEYLGKDECTVYYGLRADEIRTGYVPLGKSNIIPAYPLRDAGIDLRGVYAILDAQGLSPPDFFWQRMYDAVAERLKTWPEWEDRISRMERRVLFSGRSRANCFQCFFQAQYEFLWLYEAHPTLFARAEAMEKAEYSFQSGFFLRELHNVEKRRRIFNRRVSDVCEYIMAKFQASLFPMVVDNELAMTSCGLLCGK